MTRVFIHPNFTSPDRADGGIRRVVDAQRQWLPKYGIEVVDDPEACDVAAFHAGTWVENIRPGTPVVAHCHGLYWEGYDWRNWAIALNKEVIRNIKKADYVTGPSEWVAQAIRRGASVPCEGLHHGINPDEWHPAERKPDDIRYVLWNKTRVDAICDPTPVNELAALATDVPFITTFGDATSNVAVTGAKPYDEGKQAVRNASVYLATSRETFGIGTLEAMACGVPVLGWNWGGQAEFVRHLEHGYLAEPGNLEDLLNGLRLCLRNRDEWGLAARDYVLDQYTWEQRIKPYADIYNHLHAVARSSVRVSVVIPYYNLGKYIEGAVKSASDADEIIVVDDASPEPLPASVAKTPKVRVISNEKNLYLAETLNVGIGQSRGRYVVPLDADNELKPGALKILADALDKDPNLDIAYGKIEFQRPDETFISDWPPDEANLEAQVAHRNQISSTSMYRRRMWDRIGGYRRRCHTAEDADFWCRALAAGGVGRRVTDAACLMYRDRPSSMSHVQKDWGWHRWYEYVRSRETRPFVVGGAVHAHEFPEVSVIIPVGPGHERLVLDALDSVQNQSVASWEAVVINDTGRQLPWAHPWARVIVNTGDPGAATARNLGLHEARGKYVVFLDADDYLHHDALFVMLDVIKRDKGFVYTDFFHGETGKIEQLDDFDPAAILRKMPFSVTSMYDKTELFENNIRFDPQFDGTGWEDWDFSIQVVAKAGICGNRVAAPLSHYRYETGTLRKKAHADRDQLKSAIYTKWAGYIEGRKENMASGCGCGGGWRPSFNLGNMSVAPSTQADGSQGDTVLLEYTGNESGTLTFQGWSSGVRYRFEAGSDMAIRTVYKADASQLLALGYFRVVTPATTDVSLEPLMAAGPPVQEAAAA